MFNDVTKTDFFFFLTCRRKGSAGNWSGGKLMTIAWDDKGSSKIQFGCGLRLHLRFCGKVDFGVRFLVWCCQSPWVTERRGGSKMMAPGSSAGDQISRVEIHQQQGTSRGRETRNQVNAPRDEGRGQDVMSLNGVWTQELFANIWGYCMRGKLSGVLCVCFSLAPWL